MSIIIKSEPQIQGIRKACQLAAKTLDWVALKVAPGVSTAEIDDAILQFHLENGAIPAPLGYKGFPKSSCISLNEVICHGVPSPAIILKEGDILNIDVSPILGGFIGDSSRMYAVGKISDKAQKLIDVTKRCLDIGIEQVREGNYFGNIGYYITEHAASQGFSIVHQFCGHGVGIRFHEPPNVCHYVEALDQGSIMKAGMIFTIEPMINEGVPNGVISEADGWTVTTADKQLSAQFEHTVLVTKEGHEVLT